MRHPIKIWLASLLLVGITAGPALAVSIDDLVNLKAKGVSDAILVALIEADGTIFRLSAADIISLKKRGLSDDVMLAMINSAKPKPDAAAPRAAATAPEAETAPRNDAEAYHDEYVGAAGTPSIHVHQSVTVEQPAASAEYPSYGSYPYLSYVPVAYYGVGMPNYLSRPATPTQFVPTNIYWGFGGERRPDTWQPPFRRVVQPSPVPTPHMGLPPNTPLPKNTPLRRN